MELRHLRYFLAVAEELNFSRAAERLHIAQPPLSQQIRQLEDELGLQLLERGSRPLRLTEAGSFFRTEARQILAKLDDAVIGTRRIGRGQTGWLGVSYVTSAMSTPIQPALRRFHAEHPNVAVLLFDMLAAEQEAALLDRRAHVGFLRSTFDHEQLVEELLYDDPFVVAVPSDHRLAQRVAMRIAELAGEPIVLYGTRSIESGLVLSMFHSGGIEPEVAFQVQHAETALGLVAAGMGITLAPASFSHAPRTGVQFVPLEPVPRLPMRIVYRLHERSPAVLAFLKIVREEVSKRAGASARIGNERAL